ncbi:MAG: mycothiol conjugate amidase Mca [Bowdeniella nasicola]|nr:mycothiol conjugate amidase Mca [Bowdeniella nasicola]
MRMMAVHAHPDDESSKGAGTMARYTAQGHRVRVVTCTGGERGDILNPKLEHDAYTLANLHEVREQEMANAAKALGVEHVWLGFEDSGLPEGDPLPPLPEGCFALASDEETVPALVAQIREFRPHVLTTYNERGGYPHPDHIQTHKVSMKAVTAAADPHFHPELGTAWTVPKVYYDVSFGIDRMLAIHNALISEGKESPFEDRIRQRADRPQRTVTARIDVADYFPQRDEALRAHATQIDPDGFFFAVPRDLERRVWPWEEFELARAEVPVADLEDDLFAGIEEEQDSPSA